MDIDTWIPTGIFLLWLVSSVVVVFLFFRWWAMSAKRRLKWVSYLFMGVGGLILVVSIPMWLDWGNLYFQGIPVRAEIVSTKEESTTNPDPEILDTSHFTQVTYRFEAEVGGQRRPFQREGKLSGRYREVSGFTNVLYDPADPTHSRMTREFRRLRDSMVAAAVCLALGVVLFLLSRRRWGADTSILNQ